MEFINASELKNGSINLKIKELIAENKKEITIEKARSMHNLCVGLEGDCEINITENTGLYTGSFMDGPKVVVEESVGWYAGDDMISGELIIKKNTGCNVGAYICGGTIMIYGNTGSRCGYGMKGGNIIVGGNCGRWAAYMSTGGNMVVLGNLGEKTGESMYKGRVFTRDKDAESKIGGNVFLDTITDDEIKMLDDMFEKYGLDAKGSEFKVIRPVLSGRHNYVLFNPVIDIDSKKYKG